jgi:hypothetical protein
VPSGRIYSIADIAADLHYRRASMIERHCAGGNRTAAAGFVPKMSETPGEDALDRADAWANTRTRCSPPRYDAARIRRSRRGVIA